MAGVRTASLLVWLMFGCAWADTQPRHLFNIESQPLGDALQEFAGQSGVQVIFFSKLVEGLSAPALHGRYTSTEALDRLLANSALTYHQINPMTIEIRASKAPVDSQGDIARLAEPGTHERRPQRLVVDLVEYVVHVDRQSPVRVNGIAGAQI
jgi:iron complex outermembrane receptor protein